MRFSELMHMIRECVIPVELKELQYHSSLNFQASEMDVNNDDQLSAWCSICNSAYSDSHYSLTEGRSFFQNHPIMTDFKTLLFYDEQDKPFATISYGVYKSNPECGGLFRLAVLPEYQGNGIGAYLIAFGCTRLMEKGVSRIESIITYKRKKSLRLHFSLGFIPTNMKKSAFPVFQSTKSLKRKLLHRLMWCLVRKEKLLSDIHQWKKQRKRSRKASG